jgi:hypothetical protein
MAAPNENEDAAIPLSSFSEDPGLLDRLSTERFLQVASYVLGARGYDLLDWKPGECPGAFRNFAMNLYTELAAVIECSWASARNWISYIRAATARASMASSAYSHYADALSLFAACAGRC